MDFEKNKLQAKILEIRFNLKNTDYVANKLTEALAEYIVYGNSQPVIDMYNEYFELIRQRKAWREEINTLETQLNLYKGV